MAIARSLAFMFSLLAATACVNAADPNAPISDSRPGASAAAIDEGIVGTVTSASGEPVVGAFVQVAPVDEASGPIPEIAIFTDSNGHFAWPLRSGAYRITLLLDGRDIGGTQAVVKEGQVTTLVVKTE